jgi:hypothetical protein
MSARKALSKDDMNAPPLIHVLPINAVDVHTFVDRAAAQPHLERFGDQHLVACTAAAFHVWPEGLAISQVKPTYVKRRSLTNKKGY